MPHAPAPVLKETRIGIHLGHLNDRVAAMGSIQQVPAGTQLCCKGDRSRNLFVILSGEVDYGAGWLGRGGHLGELGFLLGMPRTSTLTTLSASRIWSISSQAMGQDPEASTALISALVRELPKRIHKFDPPPPTAREFCDHTHPAITSLAHALRRESDEESAIAIWSFVRDMPYRFGPWWQRASDTLRAGWGMCTTKSNLEVALFRSADLEAGFVELHFDKRHVEPLIPESYRRHIKQQSRHYMGAVKLSERWHVAECSFPLPLIDHLARSIPSLTPMLNTGLAVGQPYNTLAALTGSDPFDVVVIDNLTKAMARRSSFDVEQLDLLNLINDEIQGVVCDEPAALVRAQSLLAVDPRRAMQMALASAAVLAAELHDRLTENT